MSPDRATSEGQKRLAGHRHLLDAAEPELGERRKRFATEIQDLLGLVGTITELARRHEVMP